MESKGWVRRVPAAAVIPAARVVLVIIGPKASVTGFVNAWGNRAAQQHEGPGRLRGLRPGEARGTPGVEVKFCNPWGTTGGEGVWLERI